MERIAPHTVLVDLEFLGEPGHIATCVLETGNGLVLVDPGPTTCLDRLDASLTQLGATVEDVHALLVTHIHLDHAGGAGVLARRVPRLQVFAHARGAPHLADPSRLLRSAAVLYGEQMDRLWGEVAPVPVQAIRPLAGGERLTFDGRTVAVAYTPGHAWHHVAFLDEENGIAFTGDALGEQPPGCTHPLPVTPPPDVDVERMVESGRTVLAWRPARLFVTHFGAVQDPDTFVPEHERRLLAWSEQVRASLTEPGSDEARAEAFATRVRPELLALYPREAWPYVRRDILARNWFGLARYWRKRSDE